MCLDTHEASFEFKIYVLGVKMAAAKKEKGDSKRRAIRYSPDIGDYAVVCFSGDESEFKVDSVGIIINESATGCAIVVPANRRLKVGDTVVVQVGKMNPVQSTIIWRIDLDKDVVKLGIKYDV